MTTYSVVGTHVYQAVVASVSFADAVSAADALGGHLVSITSAVEQGNLWALLDANQTYWIGASDAAEEGAFSWITGESWGFTNYVPGEPDDDVGSGGNGDALAIGISSGQWIDTVANFVGFVSGFIVEFDAFQDVPEGSDTFNGSAIGDTLEGGSGDDFLYGNLGNDILRGGTGVDTLDGGEGLDWATYSDATTAVTVDLSITAQQFIGGGRGSDNLIAIENLEGSIYDDLLVGNDIANVLIGGFGNDQLNGGLGSDLLIGGFGDDTYTTDGIDRLIEFTDGGIDGVSSTSSLTLADNIENLTLTGFANTKGTGNALANIITGNGGNNTLSGGVDGFIDTLIGLTGNDTYVLGASTNDVVTDTGGTADLITSTITRSLASFAAIENLTLLGSSAINGTGNGLANIITGNTGKNTLIGGLGADTLIGGAGADSFRYNLHTEGLDKINNFDSSDFMVFKGSAFGGLTAANKAAGFVSRATSNLALDASDRLIFRQSDDTLWYDSNGSTAAGTKIMIADFSNNFNLTVSDILIV